MVAVVPRSTWIHCGSLNALDQRVPVLPSTAAEAGKVAFSVDDAVAGRPWEIRVGAAVARVPDRATMQPRSRTIAADATANAYAAPRRCTVERWTSCMTTAPCGLGARRRTPRPWRGRARRRAGRRAPRDGG